MVTPSISLRYRAEISDALPADAGLRCLRARVTIRSGLDRLTLLWMGSDYYETKG